MLGISGLEWVVLGYRFLQALECIFVLRVVGKVCVLQVVSVGIQKGG